MCRVLGFRESGSQNLGIRNGAEVGRGRESKMLGIGFWDILQTTITRSPYEASLVGHGDADEKACEPPGGRSWQGPLWHPLTACQSA